MVALLLLHVAGALKHHFVLRDDTLTRMLPGRPDMRADRITRNAAGGEG
jgi:cytochrome b561